MSATLILGGIALSVIAGICLLAYVAGKRAERQAGASKINDVREKQLEAATNAPKTKDEIVKALREKGL